MAREKDGYIGIRVTETDRRRLEALARTLDVSMSEAIRELVRREIEQRGIKVGGDVEKPRRRARRASGRE